jgi:hypothetical protein
MPEIGTKGSVQTLARRGIDLQRGLHDPYELRDLKIALAAALGRSKLRACPLDRTTQSLIGCDKEPAEVVLEVRALLETAVGKADGPIQVVWD